MIIAAPPPVSTEPSPHIIRTIGYSRPLRIVFSAAQPQLPHRLCHNFPQIRMQTLISPRIAQSTQTARPRKPQKPGKKNKRKDQSLREETFEPRLSAAWGPLRWLVARLRPIPRWVESVQLHIRNRAIPFLCTRVRST